MARESLPEKPSMEGLAASDTGHRKLGKAVVELALLDPHSNAIGEGNAEVTARTETKLTVNVQRQDKTRCKRRRAASLGELVLDSRPCAPQG